MSLIHPRDVVFYDGSGVAQNSTLALPVGTYYADLGGSFSPWDSIQWIWDATIVVSGFTYYSTNLPNAQAGEPNVQNTFWGGIRPWDAVASGWAAETAITTSAIAGGSAGNAMVHIGGNCARRLMCKIVVATGGKLRGAPHSKIQAVR